MGSTILKDALSLEVQNKLLLLKEGLGYLENDGVLGIEKQDQSLSEAETGGEGVQSLRSSQSQGPDKRKTLSPQEQLDGEKSKELFHKTKEWLESRFPNAINFKKPIPLKIGIQQDLLAAPSPCSKRQLHRCLGSYCSSRRYLKAILQENWRHDLNGEKVEEISQEHKDRAIKELYERKKKFQTAQMHPLKRSYDKISNAAQVIAGDDEPQQGKNARGQSSSR